MSALLVALVVGTALPASGQPIDRQRTASTFQQPMRAACSAGTSFISLGLKWTCQKAGAQLVYVAVASAENRPGYPASATGACMAGDWMRIGPLTLKCRTVKGRGVWTRTERGAKFVAAESQAQSLKANVPGTCHVGAWIRVAGTKVGCTTSAGPRGWIVDGVRTVVPTPGVLRTLPENQWNTLFQIHPRISPEVGQSFQVDTPVKLADATIYPVEMTWGDADYWAGWPTPDDSLMHVSRDPAPIPNTVTATVYRSSAGMAPLAPEVNVASGFTEVGRGVSTSPTVLGQPYTVTFNAPIDAPPGQYLIVFGYQIPNSSIVTLRISGWQSGTKTTMGDGPNGAPSACTYTPSPEAYPQGRAYTGTGTSFGTTFVYKESKVYDCGHLGPGKGVVNQGDIAVQFTAKSATAQSAAAPSIKAPLPRTAYAGLACDPFDPRLRRTVLPNGVGPEARVAAACGILDWLSAPSATSRPIQVRMSPNMPAKYEGPIRTAIAAGDRLFGRYGSAQRSYEMIASAEPSWSCALGTDLFTADAVGLSARTTPWSSEINSGCAGAVYRAGVWQAATLGASADRYLAWSLLTQADLAKNLADELYSPMWSMRFLAHEFSHDIQRQRAAMHADPAINGSGALQSPGSWFTEGQAQYLGYQAGSLSSTTPDLRQHMLDSLAAQMGLQNRTYLSMTEVSASGNMDLVYAAGYFAYEYLLAHYGPQALWSSWDVWNSTPCEATVGDTCWRSHSAQVFGVDADELLARVNAYVSAQVTTT